MAHIERATRAGLAYYATIRGPLAIPAGDRNLLIRTGNHQFDLQFFEIIFSSDNFSVTLYEAPTVTNDGTPVSVKNFNRKFSDDPTDLLMFDDAVASGGEELTGIEFIGRGNQRVDFIQDNRPTIRMKKNTDYIITINNEDGTNTNLERIALYLVGEA